MHYLLGPKSGEIPDPIVDAANDKVRAVTVEELVPKGLSAPLIIPGVNYSTLLEVDIDVISQLVQAGVFLIIVPPFGQTVEIEVPNPQVQPIQLTKGVDNNSIGISGGLRQHIEYETVTVQTSRSISGLQGEVIGTNTQGHAVIGKWRARNVEGGFIVCTAHIDRISIDTNEKHRRELFRGLISYGLALMEETPSKSDETRDEAASTVRETDVDRSLIALHQLLRVSNPESIQIDPTTFNQVLPRKLFLLEDQISSDDLEEELKSLGVVKDGQIDPEQIRELVEKRNLRSFVRRLENE